jgi:hypothetical protein
MKQRKIILLIFTAGLALNAVGYLLYRSLLIRPSAPSREPAAPPGPSAEQRARDEQGRARRAAGLSALVAGEYDSAVASFAEAEVLMGEGANVGELLRIAQDLQARAAAAKAAQAAPADAVPVPPQPKPEPKPAPAKLPPRLALRPPPSAAEPRAGEAGGPSTGVLLISTTPRGLLVQLDEAALDLTPARATVKAGAHKVSLYDGERRLLETTVQVSAGEVATLRRDLTAEMEAAGAQRPRETVGEAGAPAAALKPAALQPAAPPETAAREIPAAAPAQARGGLDITSPGLYAEVWINGRSYGFPPVAARNLPVGMAEIEVRVNGAVKRKAKATVQAGQVVSLKVR